MVVLVPRQLQMTGMTGQVPYYGGRFTPAQAYAAAHPAPAPPRAAPPPPRASAPPAAPAAPRGPLEALDSLLEQGVITPQEYADLRARAVS
jgi:hypothetical protein